MPRYLTPPGVAARLKDDRARGRARRLRKSMTPAEKALWYALRRIAPEEAHFRKQAPIGPFIADFASHAARLIVELEGGAHLAPDVAARDLERRQWLEGRGYLVLTFANAEALSDSDGLAERIAAVARSRLRASDGQE